MPEGAAGFDSSLEPTTYWNSSFMASSMGRSGREILTRDFEQFSPKADLAQNLSRTDYVSIVCGSQQELPQALDQLDRQKQSLPVGPKPAEAANPESASHSRNVQTKEMTHRSLAAARKSWKKMVARLSDPTDF